LNPSCWAVLERLKLFQEAGQAAKQELAKDRRDLR
jgi:hypothetical protein